MLEGYRGLMPANARHGAAQATGQKPVELGSFNSPGGSLMIFSDVVLPGRPNAPLQPQAPSAPSASSSGPSASAGPDARASLPAAAASTPASPRATAALAASPPGSPTDRVTRRESHRSALALAEAAREEEARRREAEDQVLDRAAQIVRMQRSWKRAPAVEQKRDEGHWDVLLKEMQFMAKSFAWERKEHQKQARQVAKAAARSNMDASGRARKREQEEEARTRKRASFIAKEVRKFWGKVERVVAYKRQSLVDSRKKEAMDKHLTFLLGQTQRYSSLLAQRLGNTNTTNASATPAASEGGPSQPVLQANEQPLLLGSGLDAAADDSVPAQQPVSHAQPMDEDAGSDGDDAQQGDWMSEDGAERIEEDAADRDYAIRAGDHEQVDDEATLEEEEALEEAAGAPDRSRELADLENEAEMPLEQLLASYGFIMGADDEQPKDEPAVNVDQQPEPEDADLDAMASDSDEGAAVQGGDDSADNEYTRDAESEPDDEATLDEEELAAQAHGEDRQAAEAAELAELQAEADLPIEALLARYGHLREGPEAAGGEAAAAEAGAADVASAMDVDPAEPAAAGGQAAAVKDKEQPPASAKGKPKMSKNRDDESVPEGLVTGGSSGERMEGAAAMAVAAQPTGHTLQTTKVGTEVWGA
ncbi:hypothetical protein WJX73_007998 [Symbiochloris irregularis]|uniref:HSA domain-containing protein n=1 Tax=Symbiochloris irregularis TaxID=706552 RepID=A0AAW1NTZ6_9CHLO